MTDHPTSVSEHHEPVTIAADATEERELILALLRRVFQEIDGMPTNPDQQPEDGVAIVGFRATASDLSSLILAALDAALEEADAQQVTVVGVDVAGIMPIDEGVRCWGYLATIDREAPRPAITVVPPVTVVHGPTNVRAEAQLRLEESTR